MFENNNQSRSGENNEKKKEMVKMSEEILQKSFQLDKQLSNTKKKINTGDRTSESLRKKVDSMQNDYEKMKLKSPLKSDNKLKKNYFPSIYIFF